MAPAAGPDRRGPAFLLGDGLLPVGQVPGRPVARSPGCSREPASRAGSPRCFAASRRGCDLRRCRRCRRSSSASRVTCSSGQLVGMLATNPLSSPVLIALPLLGRLVLAPRLPSSAAMLIRCACSAGSLCRAASSACSCPGEAASSAGARCAGPFSPRGSRRALRALAVAVPRASHLALCSRFTRSSSPAC